MIARRPFIQSFLSALTTFSLPSSSRNLPPSLRKQRPLEPRNDEQALTADVNSITDKQFKLIGVGGAGGNAVGHMMACGVQGVEFICANSDAEALAHSWAHKTIQLGSSGLGTGSLPDIGREAAAGVEDEIRAAIDGAQMLFITAGMGGGTGTGAAPVIARLAKDMGILTVGWVTLPFEFEGDRRWSNAQAGLTELQTHVDTLIVVSNETLLALLGDEVIQDEFFGYANDLLKIVMVGMVDVINVPSAVNVDFRDVRAIMGASGRAMMGTAMASGPDRARLAAEQAVAHPLLEGIDLFGAKGVLVLITVAEGTLKLSEVSLAMDTIRAHTSSNAPMIFGTTYDASLKDLIRVTVVATGLNVGALKDLAVML